MNNTSFKKPVIICVDDEKIILDSLNRQLQRHFGDQYEYEFCESADEALELINQLNAEGYSVIMVISDQIMPGMSGDQFLVEVQESHPKIIKILLTGQASLESAIRAINKANLYRYITKPWSESDFLLTVAKGLQEYNLLECTLKQAEVFEKFVPKQFLQCLSKKEISEVQLGDHIEREMSILFVDIRNFTTISESFSPEENYNFINEYLNYVEPTIQSNNGFIDKYIGDAVIALFQTADDALHAALDMRLAVAKFNEDHKSEKYYPVVTGVGLHVGMLMLGIVGVENRMQGTVISDAVNVASRLQDLAGIYDLRIVASEEFINTLKDKDFVLENRRFLGGVYLKGKKQNISISEVMVAATDPNSEMKLSMKQDFEHGIELFQGKKFAEACVKFKSVLEKNPFDKVTKLYLNLSAEYMLKGVPDIWDSALLYSYSDQKTSEC